MDARLQHIRYDDVLDFAYGKGYAQGTCVGWQDDPRLGRCVIVYHRVLRDELYVPLHRVVCRYRPGAVTINFE